MTATRDQVLTCLYSAVDEINEHRSADEQLDKAEATTISGPDASLDSLGYQILLNLAVLLF